MGWLLEQTHLACFGHRLCAAGGSELAADALGMGSDGVERYIHAFGDLAIGQVAREEAQQAKLGVGQGLSCERDV